MHAASDREHAAADREHAAEDREHARADREANGAAASEAESDEPPGSDETEAPE